MRSLRHLAIVLAAAIASGAPAVDAATPKTKIATKSRQGGDRVKRGPRPTTRPFVRTPAKLPITKAAKAASRKRQLADQHERSAQAAEAEAARLDGIAQVAEAEVERLAGELGTATAGVATLRERVAQLRLEIETLRGRAGKGSKKKAARRQRQLDQAEARLATADQQLAAAEGALPGLEGEVQRARGEATTARGAATASAKTAGAARTKADRAKRIADEHDALVAAEQARRDQRKGNRDQHAAHIAQQGSARRALYHAAVKKTRLWTMIEPKPGEVSQDAVAAAPELGLFAIADGVTNSSYSGEFARALVRRWTEQPPSRLGEFASWMTGAQDEWAVEVEPKLAPLRKSWYNRNKVFQGDAAFVGAKLFRNGEQRRLHLMGIGDTVAILVRGGKLKQSFPLVEAHEFSNEVKALPSIGDAPFKVRETIWDVKPGDEIFMATDALAAWLFTEVEAGRDPFPQLRQLKTAAEMNAFVERARAGELPGVGQMNVDDTTLARFVVPVS
jgi:hypothetical protein